jgi:hypothetical protein
MFDVVGLSVGATILGLLPAINDIAEKRVELLILKPVPKVISVAAEDAELDPLS